MQVDRAPPQARVPKRREPQGKQTGEASVGIGRPYRVRRRGYLLATVVVKAERSLS
jgi:hypothetical protein